MKIQKRIELQLAAGDAAKSGGMQYDAIRVSDDGKSLEATDGIIIARVPLGAGGVRPEAGEEIVPGAVIEPRAWAEAARGTTGEGTLRLQFGAQVAISGDKKPALHFAPPEFAPQSERPPIQMALNMVENEYRNLDVVELVLDPEALYRLARALGAGSEGVRISIPVRHVPGPASDGLDVTLEPTFGLKVTPAEGGGAWGVIMPISREGR